MIFFLFSLFIADVEFEVLFNLICDHNEPHGITYVISVSFVFLEVSLDCFSKGYLANIYFPTFFSLSPHMSAYISLACAR